MTVTVQAVQEALKAVTDPHTGKDFVSTKAIKNLRVEGSDVAFDVELGYPANSLIPQLHKALVEATHTVPGVSNASVNISMNIGPRRAARRAIVAGRQKHCGRGFGQRWRGQEYDRCQSGAGIGR